jgi:hypothetical protein
MPDGTRAGGGMPGPTLDVHGAAAIVADAAEAWSGTRSVTRRRAAARRAAAGRAELGRAGLRFFRVDPEVGDGLRNEVRTVLLAEGERV